MKITVEKLAAMPVVKAEWSHDHADFDIWLSARERSARGLIWLYHCKDHDQWFVLAGAPATVHGPWKRQWHQGVIKLPEGHKECDCEIFHEGEWEMKVENPLSLIQPPVFYGWSGLMFTVGDLTEITLTSRHSGWEAVLEFSLGQREAVVTLSLAKGLIRSSYPVEYEAALGVFGRLLELGQIRPERQRRVEDRFSHLARYNDPKEAFSVLSSVLSA